MVRFFIHRHRYDNQYICCNQCQHNDLVLPGLSFRTRRNSLKECVDCHSTTKNDEYVPINTPEQFQY
jgi:hypothetical protein